MKTFSETNAKFAALAASSAMALALYAAPVAAQECEIGDGNNSLQCGLSADAQGDASTSVGTSSSASGAGSVAVGVVASAEGDNSTAVGPEALTTGTGATALGYDSEAGLGGTALGQQSTAFTGGTAVGGFAQANSPSSVAIGLGASADHNSSVALGAGSVTSDPNTVSVGSNNIQRRITNVADGIFSNDAATVGQLEEVTAAVVNTNQSLQTLGNEVSTVKEQVGVNTIAIGNLKVANDLQDAAIAENAEGVTKLFAAVDNQSFLISDNTAGIDLNSAAIADNAAMLDEHDQRLMALEAVTFDLGNTLARFDDEIDGSTAVAIAMSGNAFLPNKKVNVTSNMGFYNGALAGSLQIGVLVSEKVAVNAGIATGFNKGGKTGGRVGVSFGW